MLIVGADNSALIENLPDRFLLIDDGPLLDRLDLPENRKKTVLDLSSDSLDVLDDMTYRKARDFISVLDAVFPEGESTLTKKASNFALLKALLARPRHLYRLIEPIKNDPGSLDAYQKIQTLLLSPVLKRFLANQNHHTNFSLDGILLAKLDRTLLADFDAFVIANLLISNYKYTVIVPDFGFYGCKFHVSLMRQGRLRAGVRYLDGSLLKNELLTMEPRIARKCSVDDAILLAKFAGLVPDQTRADNPYNEFIRKSIIGEADV